MAVTAKFKGSDFVKQVKKALDDGTAQLLTNTQSKLSASSPVDTGRLASSWMIGHNSPDTSVAPENIGKPAEREVVDGKSYKVEGTNTADVSVKKYSGQITFDGDWYVSNNLPYAKRAAYDPGYTGRRGGGAGDWYSQIVNQLPADAKRTFNRTFKKIK